MSIKEISKMLIRAKRPIDFFGKVDEVELKKIYREYAKMLHPDTANVSISNAQEKYLASEAFKLLSKMYKDGLKEIANGTYAIIDKKVLYEKATPIFTFDIADNTYKFYEHYCDGEVARIYKGTDGKYIVYLKVVLNSNDNDLIKDEIEVLSSLQHASLPIVEQSVMINNSMGFIMREIEGLSVPELLDEYSNGIPSEHVMWILERLFSVSGYLHSNCVVHGNIKPEHVIINPDTHNVSLLGFSMCIKNANLATSKYKIINDDYTAPEVGKDTKVLPNTDIYAIGKIAITLLGGDIKSNGMPIIVEPEIRKFIRKIVNQNPAVRPNDAWALWDETIELRNKVYGTERFKKLERKK